MALVTGASSGIGRATVVELRHRGVKVMAVARREHLLAQLADETGPSYVACSLETRDACELAVEATRSHLGLRPNMEIAAVSEMVIQGSETHLHVAIDLAVSVNDAPHFHRHWVESIPRNLL